MCPFSRFMTICTISNSIYTLTAIGIERYWKFILLFDLFKFGTVFQRL
jgi:hypothetical protein